MHHQCWAIIILCAFADAIAQLTCFVQLVENGQRIVAARRTLQALEKFLAVMPVEVKCSQTGRVCRAHQFSQRAVDRCCHVVYVTDGDKYIGSANCQTAPLQGAQFIALTVTCHKSLANRLLFAAQQRYKSLATACWTAINVAM